MKKEKKNHSTSIRKVNVILPAYNEEHQIASLLEHIQLAMNESSLSYQVIIIDDGSSDGTYFIVKQFSERMPIIIKTHDQNKGLGYSIHEGLIYAVSMAREHDIIVTMDADDTHTPGIILRMVRMIMEGYDVVIASRYQHESRTIGVPIERRILSYMGSLLCRIIFPIQGVHDYTCSYRAYRAMVIKDAFEKYGDHFVDQDGFQCMVDILLKLRKEQVIFGEVPFLLRYDNKKDISKMNVPQTTLNTLKLLFLRRFLG
jgi:dolichol-phosphate mannosyltransferase